MERKLFEFMNKNKVNYVVTRGYDKEFWKRFGYFNF